jgi:ribosomal protein L18
MNVTHRFVQFNGTATKPRLSVFCSNRQLYAVLADDHNKKVLFYGSTLQKSICGDPSCSTVVSRRLSSSSSEICITAGRQGI